MGTWAMGWTGLRLRELLDEALVALVQAQGFPLLLLRHLRSLARSVLALRYEKTIEGDLGGTEGL